MPNFPMLDVAIGLVFVYLLLSLICSSLHEGLESLLRNRANDLEAGIRILLGDPRPPGWKSWLPWAKSLKSGTITAVFYRHPLIRCLFRDEKDLPTYIPARNFSLALLDLLAPDQTLVQNATVQSAIAGTGEAGGSPSTISAVSITAAVNEIPVPENLRRSIAALIAAAAGDAERARQNIEGWFNNTMDRASGWYKHRTQYFLFAIGFLITVLLNADSLQMFQSLMHSQNLAAVVASAERFSAGTPLAQTNNQQTLSDSLDALQSLDLGIGWVLPDSAQTCIEQERNNKLPPDRQKRDSGVFAADGIAIPTGKILPQFLGVTKGCAYDSALHPFQWSLYLLWVHLIGWVITSAAIALGAPFWFDTLNRFIVVRSTVKPKEKSSDEPSKS